MVYASIDIETTGLDPDHDQVLQIAAVIDGPAYYTRRVDELPAFNMLVRRDRVSGDPFALAMNADLLRRISEHNKCLSLPQEVGEKLATFLSGYLDNGRITAAGKNFASFDRQFLRRMAPEAIALIHHRSIDPGTMYATPEDRCPPSTEECLKRAGLSLPVTHDALADARLIVRLIRTKWGGNQA